MSLYMKERMQTARLALQSQRAAFDTVECAFKKQRVEYILRREELRFDIPNLEHCFEKVVGIASRALRGTEYCAQEMPYRELMRVDSTTFSVEYLLILHRDGNQ